MKKVLLVCLALLALAAGASAQNETDSVRISGKLILDFDELGNPEPFSGAELLILGNIDGNDYLLATATANQYGEFTFTMPKGKYEVGLWRYQAYKDYVLVLEVPSRRKVDAQTNVYLGEWTPVIESHFQYYPAGEMQKMKINGVKVTVR